MDNILIIQLARMGDFIQTTRLLCGIRQTYPGSRIWVLVDSSVCAVAQHSPDVDHVLSLDTAGILNLEGGYNDICALYAAVKSACRQLMQLHFDCVINVNYSYLAALVAALFPGARTFGYTVDGNRTLAKRDPWIVFMNAAVQNPPLAPFNLVDYFYYMLRPLVSTAPGLSLAFTETQHTTVYDKIFPAGMPPPRLLVALQLGTRHSKRQWPAGCFSSVVRLLLKHDGLHVLLLGTSGESCLGDALMRELGPLAVSHAHRVHNLIGCTTFPELACVLKHAQLLVSGDTGTMHLAAAVGCRVLALFFGSALAHHTGPYASGNWAIQAALPCCPCPEDSACANENRCRSAISPRLVAELAEHILFHHPFDCRAFHNVNILTSGMDDLGIVFNHAFEEQMTEQGIRNYCYRAMGRSIIKAHDRSDGADCLRRPVLLPPGANDQLSKLIESTRLQGQRIISSYYSDARTPGMELPEGPASFWYPWIRYYQALQQNTPAPASQHTFVSGLYRGVSVLESLQQTYH